MTKATQNNPLAIFDTEGQSEAGSWLHLTIPCSDEKAYADPGANKLPMRIKLKGPESDTWVAFQRKAAQINAKGDKRSIEDVKRDDSKLFAAMTLDIENITGHENSAESLYSMYHKYRDLRIQALGYLMKRENFIGKAESE